MAPFREHRTHTRVQCRVPLELKHTARRREHSAGATIFNVSEEGVYLETDERVDPGELVHINLAQVVPRVRECSRLCNGTGIIRWIRPVKEGRRHVYGAGISLSRPCVGEEALEGHPDVLYFCDMCGRAISLWDVRQGQGPVWLCARCRRHLEGFPEAVCRMTERYLIGNVL